MDTIKKFLLNSSKGLAEVTRSKIPTVQFIHESVRDFLLKEDGLSAVWPNLAMKFAGQSHDRLKQCCIRYFGIDISDCLDIGETLPRASSAEGKALRQKLSIQFPFFQYAVENALWHADEAQRGGTCQKGFLGQFDLPRWLHLRNVVEKFDARRHTPRASLLYIFGEFNLPSLIRAYDNNLHSFGVEDERYGAPILAASTCGSQEAVTAMLEVQRQAWQNISTAPVEWKAPGRRDGIFSRDFSFSGKRGLLSYMEESGDDILLTHALVMGACDIDAPLCWAVGKGHEAIVQLLLATDQVDVEAKSSSGQTPLSLAAERGHEVIVQLLLATGQVDVEAKDKRGWTPLSLAAANGHEAIVQQLLATECTDHNRQATDGLLPALLKASAITCLKTNGQTPLSWAAESGHEVIIQLLLAIGQVDVDAKSSSGQTPLSLATERGYEVIVKLLLENGADIESKDNQGQTPLSRATAGGHEAIVKLLLENGADIESKNNRGQTPLSRATEGGHEAIVKLLLENGADIESKDDRGRTLLSRATAGGHEVAMKLLLENGADTESEDYQGWTPLSHAAARNCIVAVKLLLENGGNIESRDSHGRTPLSHAATRNCVKTVDLLLKAGAYSEAKDEYGWTPLGRVVAAGHDHVLRLLFSNSPGCNFMESQDCSLKAAVEFLLEIGFNTELKDDRGQTLLSHAAARGHEPTTKLLLDNDADLESKDHQDRTPLSHAAAGGHRAVVELLVKKGAATDAKDGCGWTPLIWASRMGQATTVDVLLKAKIVGVNTTDMCGRTSVLWAAAMGHLNVVKILGKAKGVTVDLKDHQGRTPLSWAAAGRTGQGTISDPWPKAYTTDFDAPLLMEFYGASPNYALQDYQMQLLLLEQQNKKRLMMAREEQDMSGFGMDVAGNVVLALLEIGGVAPDSKDIRGRTPLSFAAEAGVETTTRILLSSGKANVDLADDQGRTPRWYATKNGHRAIARLLQGMK